MKTTVRFAVAALCAGLLVGGSTIPLAHVTYAVPLAIPAGLYPAGADISYFPNVSNRDVDCDWGVARSCSDGGAGAFPAVHQQSQQQLHRVGGWAQVGLWHRGASVIVFALYSSRYALRPHGATWSARALRDLDASTGRYATVSGPIHLRFASTRHTVITKALHAPGVRSYLLACQVGSRDIESIVVVRGPQAGIHRNSPLIDLTRQVQAAVDRAGL